MNVCEETSYAFLDNTLMDVVVEKWNLKVVELGI